MEHSLILKTDATGGSSSASSSSLPPSTSIGGHSFTPQVRKSRAHPHPDRNPFIFALGPKRVLVQNVNLVGRELDLIDLMEYASKNPRWSKEEDGRLLSLVETYGGRWTLIAGQMTTHRRNGKQIRNRYFYVLDKNFEPFVRDHKAVMSTKQVCSHCV